MPPLYVFLAAALVIGALYVLVWAFRPEQGLDPVQANLGRAGTAPSSREVALSASARDRIFQPIFDAIANRAKSWGPLGATERVKRKLDLSGLTDKGWRVERMVVIRVLALGVGIGVGVLAFGSTGGAEGLGLAVLAVLIGYLGPEAALDRRVAERQGEIEKSLPSMIDQLTVSVEAGLGFDAALARAGEGRTGPLADELARVMQDLQVGVPRQEALDRMVERTEVADLRSFVVALRHSNRHGVPMAGVLQIQSSELRDKRRARIEEKAAQLPVKIVFPLVFCILPSLFVIILGPAAISITDSF